MRVRTNAVVLACLAAVGLSGCTQPTETCGVADYGGGGMSGYQTPQQALQSQSYVRARQTGTTAAAVPPVTQPNPAPNQLKPTATVKAKPIAAP